MDPASHRPVSVNGWVAPADAPAGSLLLSADVGGTHARLAVLDGAPGRPPALLHYRAYRGADHASLPDVLDAFLASLPLAGIDAARLQGAVLACAGYVLDDAVVNDNLPWALPIEPVRRCLGLPRLAVINDFEALAHGLAFMDPAAARPLVEGTDVPAGSEPMVVMGPGTGLGCAAWLPGGRVLTTEAGQIAFAPGTPREVAIREVLATRHEYVAVEQLLSGPGLLKVYRALGVIDGRAGALASPEEITRHGLAGTDAHAREALEVFAGVLGSFSADLAMLYGALGGIYLAGGFLPRLHDFLLQSTLRERFHARGVMRPWLARVPVRVIEHGQLGVLGAAQWFGQHHPLAETP
jgi:glucokinase